MQLGDFAVTFTVKETSEGKFFAVARVAWQEAGKTRIQDWAFKGNLCDTAAEAIMVAEGRIGHLFMTGKLGGR